MRKRRAIIFDDGPRAQATWKPLFDARGYKTIIVRRPVTCPVYGKDGKSPCPGRRVCSDIIIIADNMPTMNGMKLLTAQSRNGCPLTPRNKAIISRVLPADQRVQLKAMGAAFFRKPLDLGELEAWVEGCETRMDLAHPLAVKRGAKRQDCCMDIRYRSVADDTEGCATALNVSSCGICLKSLHRLKPKQVLHLWSQDPGFSEEALVRWVMKADDGTYLAGLTFCV